MGGVRVPYNQAMRNVRRLRWATLEASAMKSYVEADSPRYLRTQARSSCWNLAVPIFCCRA
jgi:hypothetical protein